MVSESMALVLDALRKASSNVIYDGTDHGPPYYIEAEISIFEDDSTAHFRTARRLAAASGVEYHEGHGYPSIQGIRHSIDDALEFVEKFNKFQPDSSVELLEYEGGTGVLVRAVLTADDEVED